MTGRQVRRATAPEKSKAERTSEQKQGSHSTQSLGCCPPCGEHGHRWSLLGLFPGSKVSEPQPMGQPSPPPVLFVFPLGWCWFSIPYRLQVYNSTKHLCTRPHTTTTQNKVSLHPHALCPPLPTHLAFLSMPFYWNVATLIPAHGYVTVAELTN